MLMFVFCFKLPLEQHGPDLAMRAQLENVIAQEKPILPYATHLQLAPQATLYIYVSLQAGLVFVMCPEQSVIVFVVRPEKSVIVFVLCPEQCPVCLCSQGPSWRVRRPRSTKLTQTSRQDGGERNWCSATCNGSLQHSILSRVPTLMRLSSVQALAGL